MLIVRIKIVGFVCLFVSEIWGFDTWHMILACLLGICRFAYCCGVVVLLYLLEVALCFVCCLIVLGLCRLFPWCCLLKCFA